ncbi:MAG: sialidase family protein [Nocardioidaceae bacterium]
MAALVAVSMFGVPSQAQERDPYTSDVTVATAADGKGLWFPDIVKLDDGTLLAAFYEAEGHSGPQGRILVAESSDGGQTWSSSRLAVETPFDDRDPKLVQLSDGTVLLSFFQTDWSERPATLRGTYVVRSDDAGRSWSEPVQVETAMDCGCGAAAGAYLTGWAASHGPVTELPNGDLLVALYGTVPDDARQQATVVRSTDGGVTWPADSEVRVFRSETFHVQEPTLAVLDSGRIVALLRTTSSPQVAYISWSATGGQRWTPARATDIPASSHHLLPLSDGGMLVTYGDVSSRFSPRRETAGRIVDYPDGTWDGYHDIMLYDSGHGDQANPSSAEIEPGRFLTLSNDLPNRTIVGVFSSRDDYQSPLL